MKTKKILLPVVLILSLLLSGCNHEAIIDNALLELAQQLTEPEDVVEPFIGFAREDVEDVEDLHQLEPEMLQNYISEYSRYNTYSYFQHLNDTEKLVYRAYEYAMDHGYPYTWFDIRLTDGIEWSVFDILQFLALDSALVDQNISQSIQVKTVTHSVLNIQTAKETYATVYMDHFTLKRLERKQQAMSEARVILEDVSPSWTDRQKAEYFYDYLGDNIIYYEYENEVRGDEYLYSALCRGTANCDGYTNAFALLCHMENIRCIEINSDTPLGEVGHTWNAVYLDDQWVYVDCTAAESDLSAACENRRRERIYFGFPDALLQYAVLHRDMLPDCSVGLTPILHIPSGKIEDFDKQVKAAFQENNRECAVILVDEGDLEDQITEDLATKLNFDLYYVHYETAEGKTVYYLFNDEG